MSAGNTLVHIGVHWGWGMGMGMGVYNDYDIGIHLATIPQKVPEVHITNDIIESCYVLLLL